MASRKRFSVKEVIELLCIPDGAISYAESGPDDDDNSPDFNELQSHDADNESDNASLDDEDLEQIQIARDVVVYPLPWPLLVGGVRCSRLWSTSQLLRPSGQQCSHSGGVCPQIQGRQCGAYVGAVEEMMCVVCVDVTEGA